MKKTICLLTVCALLLSLCACAQKPVQQEAVQQAPAEWSRDGFFTDESGSMLSVTWMDDIVDPGWYVGCMLGEDPVEDSWGGTLGQEGESLHGVLDPSGSRDALTVTVSEEGEDGLLLSIEGGESYHFTRMELPEATITVTINTEGRGSIAYAEGENAPEFDPDYPFQSAWINLAEPAVHTIEARPGVGSVFVKWTKNGEDFSAEPQFTLLLEESADFIAVFEEDPDWQNPAAEYVGDYQAGRAHAQVEAFGVDEAWITIEWGSSAWELTRWFFTGKLDSETRTITYEGCSKANLVYGDDGEIKSEEQEYGDGTGTIAFHDDGTFTWHEDQADRDGDLLFERLPGPEGDAFGAA